MKIIEVRDGFINFEADENVYLSCFVRVTGMDKDYIAQVVRIMSVGTVSVATAKILFIMKDEALCNYDRTIPSRDADIEPFTNDILINSIKASGPVIIGKTYDNAGNIVIDSSAFDKKMLISIDDADMNNTITANLSKQFEHLKKKTVVIDSLNIINAPKLYAGKDLKLPLNKSTMKYLYNACINDATTDSRPVIAEVFNDLSEYSETVPFVSFALLKSIVDDMVDKRHIFKLLVLKNRLANIQKYGYFADNQSEVDSLDNILKSQTIVVDISKIDSYFQTCYLDYMYSSLKGTDTQVLFDVSNNISKHSLKMVMYNQDVSTTLVVNSKYKYLNDIKALFDNFIIEPSAINNKVFHVYSTFLTSMPENTYLITGEGINYIPMISKAQVIDEVAEPCPVSENDQEAVEYDAATEDAPNVDESSETAEQQKEAEDSVIHEEIIEEAQSQDEILANISQKSEEVINSVAEQLNENQVTDIFDSEQQEDDEAEMLDIDAPQEDTETLESDASEDFIEPEYTEIPSDTNAADSQPEEAELLHEESVEDLSEETVNEISEPDTEVEELADSEENLVISDEESISTEEELPQIEEETLLEELSDTDEIIGDESNEEIPEALDELSDFEQEEDINISEMPVDDEPLEEASVGEQEEFGNGDYEEILIPNDDIDGLELTPEEMPNDIAETDMTDNVVPLESSETIPLESDENLDNLEELTELNPDEADENDIIIDISDEEENINIDEELDQQIIEDVDKVYTTVKESDELEEISDSDLDLIDELNSDGEGELLEEASDGIEEGILDQPSESIIPEKQPQKQDNQEILERKDSNTPIVPVYDADIPQEDMVVSDPIQQGDSVVHAKYGNGIVEKMIKYGTKTLFSINFENIGRRLLDPTLTEIKKL